MSFDPNKVVVTRFFDEILNRQRPDAIAELVDTAVLVVHHPLLDEGSGSIRDVARLMEEFARAFPDLAYRVEDIASEGERIAVRWSARGSHDGAFRGVAPSRRAVVVSGIDMFAISNGRIIETWVSSDLLGLMTQIGAFEWPTRRVPSSRDEASRSRTS